MKLLARILGSVLVIAAGVFTWLVIGALWWLCTFGWHKRIRRVAEHGAATLAGCLVGYVLTILIAVIMGALTEYIGIVWGVS